MATDKKRESKMRLIQGRVVSDKNDKTRIILIETTIIHPLFRKTVKRSQRIKIHDEKNEAKVGDYVSAVETRPLSRHKRHRLFRILKRGEEVV